MPGVCGRERSEERHPLRVESEKGLPVVGVYMVTCGADQQRTPEMLLKQKAKMVTCMKASGQDRQFLCGRNSPDGWIRASLLQHQGSSERNLAVLTLELVAGGYKRKTVRSDGEAAMVSHVNQRLWQPRRPDRTSKANHKGTDWQKER